ncbi:cysteine-rich small domain-containing protein, partial [Oscillibacter sp.]|uniref:cysteine-rich small domain-containing protein n=1 Tax=Oscillibacter sp. TaxID=1945593 RepID=UPI002DBF5181
RDSHEPDITVYPTGTSPCTYAIEPPYREPFVRWCERTGLSALTYSIEEGEFAVENQKERVTRHYMFFQNKECEMFPCHTGVPEESFNCLFCYCPLYALGEACGGGFTYTQRGIKNCSGCTFPHRRENYDAVLARFPELAELARRRDHDK